MKSGPLFKNILSSSWFLAAVPSIAIIIFLILLKLPVSYLSMFLVFVAIYLIMFIFSSVVRMIAGNEIRSNENREILSLNLRSIQLQGLKAQLDPHFVFNILNTVASLIYLDDKEKAYDYMIKFTQLLRGIFNDSDDIYRSVSDEMELVNTYLELEKLRFGEKLIYEITVRDDVNMKELVPKFVVQTFVENSVNYGILPLPGQGFLRIYIAVEARYLKVTIEDNGVKRSVSGGIGRTAAQRLSLTNEIFSILNQMNEKQIKYDVSDIYSDDKKHAGSRVEVWVPRTEIK